MPKEIHFFYSKEDLTAFLLDCPPIISNCDFVLHTANGLPPVYEVRFNNTFQSILSPKEMKAVWQAMEEGEVLLKEEWIEPADIKKIKQNYKKHASKKSKRKNNNSQEKA